MGLHGAAWGWVEMHGAATRMGMVGMLRGEAPRGQQLVYAASEAPRGDELRRV